MHDATGRGPERLAGILGAEARLDRDAARRRRDRRQRFVARDADLPLDEVDTGRLLGDAVLDLQARVHFEEEERIAGDQELDGSDAAVLDGAHQRERGVAELRQHGGREPRRRRFLDQLLVAALHRALAAAERDDVAVRVGGDLHLDVAAALDAPLEIDARVAEGAARLVAGAAERLGELRGALDHGECRDRRRRPPPSRAAGSRATRRPSPRRPDPRAPRRSTARPARRAARRARLASILSPSAPHHRRRRDRGSAGLRAATRSAKSGSSERKPQPGHTASAPP